MIAAWALMGLFWLACVAVGMDPPELRGRHRAPAEADRWWEEWEGGPFPLQSAARGRPPWPDITGAPPPDPSLAQTRADGTLPRVAW